MQGKELKHVLDHYAGSQEARRLGQGEGGLELARSQELLKRFLPPPPAVNMDVGGGSGIYGCWMVRSGYEVHLIVIPL